MHIYGRWRVWEGEGQPCIVLDIPAPQYHKAFYSQLCLSLTATFSTQPHLLFATTGYIFNCTQFPCIWIGTWSNHSVVNGQPELVAPLLTSQVTHIRNEEAVVLRGLQVQSAERKLLIQQQRDNTNTLRSI